MSAPQLVVSGLVRPRGLVYTGGKIYFAEEGKGISVAVEGYVQYFVFWFLYIYE